MPPEKPSREVAGSHMQGSQVRAVTETIEVEVGEPETGLWCGTCLLPSAVAIPVTATLRGSILSVSAAMFCADCERTWEF